MAAATTMSLARLSGFMFLSILPCLTHATPYAGGAGTGVYFNRELPNTIGFQWRDTPLRNLTIEFWSQLIDFQQTDQYVFAYSYVDPIENWEAPSEFSVGFNSDNIFMLKAASRNNIPPAKYPAANVWARKDWFHYAWTWSMTGNVSAYVDGKLVYTVPSLELGGDFLVPFHQGGCFAAGQEADEACGAWDRLQSSDLILDELRIWDYSRSAAQIKANYRTTVPPKTPGLNLYWRFNERGSKVLRDDSVSGDNAGMMGQLPDFRNQMNYITGELVQAAPPLYVVSGAPMFGSEYTHVYVSPQASTTTLIYLPAWSDSGNASLVIRILSLPAVGTLTQLNGAAIAAGDAVNATGQIAAGAVGMSRYVKYTTGSAVLNASVTFVFRVSDASGTSSSTVVVWPQKALAPPRNKTYTTGEDTWLQMHMHGLTETGDQLRGRVDTLPTKGKIYQAGFADSVEKYTNLLTDASKLKQITQVGTLIDNKRGILLFMPDPDEFSLPGKVYTAFTYSLVLLNTAGSIVDQTPQKGVITVYVTAINDGPVVKSMNFTANCATPAKAIPMQLSSRDIDPTFSEGAVYYRVSKPPAFGTVYQVNEDGTIAGAMNTKRLPEIKQYGSSMPWWSSQFTVCAWDLCTFPNTTCPESCADHRWWAEKALGPPDIYPAYLDTGNGWDPQWLDMGVESIDVGINDWVYVSKVEVYETQNPGSLIKLSVRSRGSTEYSTLWQGKAEALPKVATISAPPLCPLPVQGAVVRVEIDDKAVAGWQTIDTVAVTGTQDVPQGQVLNSKARIAYIPTPGIHSESSVFDTLEYVATDCLDFGAAGVITFAMDTLPADISTLVPWKILRVDVHNSVTSEALIDFSALLAEIVTAANTAGLKVNSTVPKLSDLSVIYKGISAGSLSVVYNVDPISSACTSLLGIGSAPTNQGHFLVAIDTGDTASVHAHVWVSVGGYTWRIKVVLTMLDFVANMKLRIGLAAVAALGIVLTLVIAIIVFFVRAHPIIRASQGIFLFPILLGCILSFALVFALLRPLPSRVDCMVQPWLGAWGFSLAFAPLIAKTYRLASIFSVNKKKLKITNISNRQLFGMTGAICAVLSVYVLTWCLVDPPLPVLFETETSSFTQCATRAGSGSTPGYWSLVLLAMMGVLTLWTAWLSFRVRKVPSQFNESRFIALTVYNLFFTGTVVIAFCLTFVTNPDVAFALISVGVMVVTYANLGLLFLPKLMRVWSKTPVELSMGDTTSTNASSMYSMSHRPSDAGQSALAASSRGLLSSSPST